MADQEYPIQDFSLGLDLGRAGTTAPVGALSQTENMAIRDGGIGTRWGFVKDVGTAFTDIPRVGAAWPQPDGTLKSLMATTTEIRLYPLANEAWTNKVAAPLSGDPDRPMDFAGFQGYIYFVNGTVGDGMLRWDGGAGNFASVEDGPAFRHLAVYGNRLVGAYPQETGPTDQPAKLQWSADGAPTTWTGSGTGSTLVGAEHNAITRIVTYQDRLIIFCRDAIYAADFVGGPATFRISPIVEGYGAAGVYATVRTPYGIVFLGHDNVYLFDGTPNLRPIGDPIKQYLFSECRMVRRGRFAGHWWRDKGLYLLSVVVGDDDEPSQTFAWNRNVRGSRGLGGWMDWRGGFYFNAAAEMRLGGPITIDSLAGSIDSLGGSMDALGVGEGKYSSIIARSDKTPYRVMGATTDGNSGFTSFAFTHFLDLGTQKIKRLKRVRVGAGGWPNLKVRVLWAPHRYRYDPACDTGWCPVDTSTKPYLDLPSNVCGRYFRLGFQQDATYLYGSTTCVRDSLVVDATFVYELQEDR